MTGPADDWQPVGNAAPQDDWKPVGPAPAGDSFDERFSGEPIPQPFLQRYAIGRAVERVASKVGSSVKEGAGSGTPTGFSDETLDALIEHGVFHDPATGRPGALQYFNEMLMLPAAQGWEALTRGLNAGLHGIGGFVGALREELGGSETEGNQAKREITNLGNMLLIETGMGRFTRPHVADARSVTQEVGTLPNAHDFVAAAKNSGFDEGRLLELWDERGIHPAEAVHDAASDPMLQHDLSQPMPPRGESLNTYDGTNVGFGSASMRAYRENVRNRDTMAEAEALADRLAERAGERPPRAAEEPSGPVETPGQPNVRASGFGTEAMRAWRETLAKNKIDAEALVTTEAEGEALAHSLSAAVNDLPDPTPITPQSPAPQPGRINAAVTAAADKLQDIGRDIQMLTAPMATGTRDSMAIAKDFANAMRRNRWEWSRVDDDIAKRFTPEQRTRMWNAADEESVARQLGESREHQGLVTLEPAERTAVEDLQTRAQIAWAKARDLGMVEGEGLPAYTPRMIVNAAEATSGETGIALNGIGLNLKIRTGAMKHRGHMTAEATEAAAKGLLGDSAELARDIRTLPLATAKLEDAIAGRTLIENIKDYGKRTGAETVVEGAIPTGTEAKWFTLDHPAFKTWRPKFDRNPVNGETTLLRDEHGNAIYEQVPLYVHGDFEGPLRAVLTEKNGALYGGMMALKGKTMSLIMNSPMIHNAVEWGRALPAMPGKVASFKIYFEGNRFKNDVAGMTEAIDNGLVPIGHRFFKQDIDSIMEAPDLTPGRSWTSKVLAAVPGLFDEGAGTAVKRAVDKAGDFWHNTLLWDRIADLQSGLYVNFRDDLLAKGVDRGTAAKAAAHFANRYAGALPKEAMSNGATKVANFLLFSRSFTMGNLGVLKDMLTGLPKDVLAQIERDAGFGRGAIEGAEEVAPGTAETVKYAKSMARRKAMAVVGLDMALFYVGNSILQNALNVMFNDSTLDKEMHGYVERLQNKLKQTKEHPLSLLQPFNFFQDVSATGNNEPGRQDRVQVGYAKDGTAIYARNPAGKIGEEFIGYMTGPLDMMRRKMGTIARPLWQIMANDKGFGRKIYDPDADTPGKYLQNIGMVAKHIAASQFPEGQMNAFADLVKGEGDAKVNALQALGPLAGVTFSKGAPGGPAVGEYYHAKGQHEYAVQAAMDGIRRQIRRGDIAGAQEQMTGLGMDGAYQRWVVKTTQNPATRLSPKGMRDFYLYSTPEQRARMERQRATSPLAPAQ